MAPGQQGRSVVVTGGSGKAGRAVIRELLAHGYRVMNVDLAPPTEPLCHFMRADLNDLGQAVDCLRQAAGTVDRRRAPLGEPEAVVHLAGIPAPGLAPDAVTFRNNLMTTYNVFSAATLVGLRRIVWASSETTLGLPFDDPPPAYAPINEEHPLYPNSSYALSKVLMEEMARQFSRRTGIPIVGLRFSNIMEIERYASFPDFQSDPRKRKWNLWGYVDARDVAQSCRLALEAEIASAEVFIIAAADTVMDRANRELMAEVFPGVPLREGVGDFETLLSIDKARQLLGYAPQHSWRDQVSSEQ